MNRHPEKEVEMEAAASNLDDAYDSLGCAGDCVCEPCVCGSLLALRDIIRKNIKERKISQ